MPITYTRRRLLQALSAAGVVGPAGAPHVLAATETPETPTVRLVNDGSICIAPLFAAEELLRAEGFTDIRYIATPADRQVKAVADGKLDFATSLLEAISLIEAGAPIAVLAGIHVGCFELFAHQGTRGIGVPFSWADCFGRVSAPVDLLRFSSRTARACRPMRARSASPPDGSPPAARTASTSWRSRKRRATPNLPDGMTRARRRRL